MLRAVNKTNRERFVGALKLLNSSGEYPCSDVVFWQRSGENQWGSPARYTADGLIANGAEVKVTCSFNNHAFSVEAVLIFDEKLRQDLSDAGCQLND
jgi:hypothetical protein